MKSVDCTSLALAAEQGRRRLLARLIGSIAIGVLTSSVGILVLFREHDAPALVFAMMQIGLPLVALPFMAHSVGRAWQATMETVRSFLELELERCRDQIRRALLLRWGLLPFSLLVMLFQALLIQKHPDLLSWHVSTVVGLGAPYVIAAGLMRYAMRRLKQLRQAERELRHRAATLGRGRGG